MRYDRKRPREMAAPCDSKRGPSVRILGGGVAGLACALALIRRADIRNVRVLERESAQGLRTKVGHGLILMQNGVKALRALDAEHILEGCVPLRRALIQDGAGTALHVDTLDEVYCITRAQIIDGLRAELPDDVIQLNQCCERVDLAPRCGHAQDQAQAVRFRHQRKLGLGDNDLLIGADGWRSALCEALNPGFQRPPSPVREIVTSTRMPALAAQIGNVFIKTIFPERAVAFGLLAPSPERVIGFLQFDAERCGSPSHDATPAEFRAFLHALLEDAPEPIQNYLKDADFESAHLWAPPNADLPPRLHCTNAVLVGDAAHPLLPFTSQGVSAALEDAVLLADGLAPVRDEPGGAASALATFAERRRRSLDAYVDGGRRILASFRDTTSGFALPYVDGAGSSLEKYLTIPQGHLRSLFRVLDADGDGRITCSEFHDALERFEFNLSEAEKNAVFNEIDARGDGALDVAEVLTALGGNGPGSALLQRLRAARSPRRMELFATAMESLALAPGSQALDGDRDGRISWAELLADLGFPTGWPSPAQLVEGGAAC